MKTLLTFLWHTILFTALFMSTTMVGAITLVTLAQRGGAFAAVIIAFSSIIGNLLLYIFIAIKYKLESSTKIAGIVGLLLFLPALLLLDMGNKSLNMHNW